MKPEPEKDVLGENLRRALGACDDRVDRSYADFARRLEGRGSAPRRPAAGLVTLAASLLVCAAILAAIFASGGSPVEPPVLPAQDKKAAPQETGLKDQLALLERILERTTDEKERELLQATIRSLQNQVAKSEKGKPVSKTDDRTAKLRTELDGVTMKIKMSKDADEKAALEMRAKELGQELKMLDQGSKVKEVPIKEAEAKLAKDPDDVGALVDRARWYFDYGKADLAIKDLDRALKVKPDHAPAFLLRGMAYALAGNPEAANKDVKRGAELDPAAKKEIEYAWGTLKKLGPSQPARSPKDVEQQIAALKDRLEELRAMEANAELPQNDRGRAKKEADRIQAEIEKLKSAPAPAEKEKKK